MLLLWGTKSLTFKSSSALRESSLHHHLQEKQVELEETRLRSYETTALKAQNDVQRETMNKLEAAMNRTKEVEADVLQEL